MNIVLIGYRCTGKTTVGQILAERLDWPLVDTDTLVQERAGKDIKGIVAEEGWEEFRRREREVVADVAAGDEQVVSAGGGAVLDEANREALRRSGRVVLLTAGAETIWERMKSDPKTAAERPDLTDAGGLAEVRNLLAERRETYLSACHYEIQTDRFGPEETAGRVLAWLKARGEL